ncbi:hypothetical protein JW949_02830, partial [Candidatus Woesearchaeota archaeon]|nr:hypothetical protein [Candidatus Woesearchaeota archaeon]
NKKNLLYLGGLVLSCFSFISNFYFNHDYKNTKKLLTYKQAFDISLDSLVSGRLNYKINADFFSEKLSEYGLNKKSLVKIVDDSYKKGCKKEFDESIVFIENGYFKYVGEDYELRATKLADELGFDESIIEKALKKGSSKRYKILLDELSLKIYPDNDLDSNSIKEIDSLIGETKELIKRFGLSEYSLDYFILDGIVKKYCYPILSEIKKGKLENYENLVQILDVLDNYDYKYSSYLNGSLKNTIKKVYPALSDKEKARIDIKDNS